MNKPFITAPILEVDFQGNYAYTVTENNRTHIKRLNSIKYINRPINLDYVVTYECRDKLIDNDLDIIAYRIRFVCANEDTIFWTFKDKEMRDKTFNTITNTFAYQICDDSSGT